MTITQAYLKTWSEARTRFTDQLDNLSDLDMKKKLGDSPNSIGFLIRHLADVELLFAKNVFGQIDLKVHAKTLIDKKDTGEWTDFSTLMEYQKYSSDCLGKAILAQSNSDWESEIITQEFGTKTKAKALGRIISHTAYHAGQLAIVRKYGTIK
jgi:uncharacterized damage-inducible protein DinB